jgi:hypothetical protein
MATKLSYFTLSDDVIGPLVDASVVMVNAVTGYPGSKVKTIEMADTARGTATAKLQFTLTSPVAAKFWAILNHNITAGDPIIRAYTDAGFTTPSGDTITAPFRVGDIKAYAPSMTPQMYWEVDTSGCSFSDSFFEVGKVVAGTGVHTFANDYSSFRRGLSYRNILNETIGGTAYAHRIGARRFSFDLAWNASKVAPALTEILALLELTCGGAYPFLLIPDNDAAEFYYVRASDAAAWQESAARAYLSGLDLKAVELSRGKIQVEL